MQIRKWLEYVGNLSLPPYYFTKRPPLAFTNIFILGERTKYRWNNVHTMAEAKAGLKSLLSWVRSLCRSQNMILQCLHILSITAFCDVTLEMYAFHQVVESKVAQGHLIKEKEDCRRISVTTCSELEVMLQEHHLDKLRKWSAVAKEIYCRNPSGSILSGLSRVNPLPLANQFTCI